MLKKFEVQCLKLLRQIAKGKVTIYREISRVLDSQAYRVVGRAMAKNRDLVVLPCHRVVCSDGMVGGYANGVGGYANGVDQKIKLLEREGIPILRGKVVDLKSVLYRF